MVQPPAMRKDPQQARAGALGKLDAAKRQPRGRSKERDEFAMSLNIAVGWHNHNFITAQRPKKLAQAAGRIYQRPGNAGIAALLHDQMVQALGLQVFLGDGKGVAYIDEVAHGVVEVAQVAANENAAAPLC